MHDPIGFEAMRGTAFVKHEGLPHSDPSPIAIDDLVAACGLPEPGHRSSIGPGSGRVFLVLVAKEIPIILWCGSYPTLL